MVWLDRLVRIQTVHVHFTQMSEKVAASPGNSLFAKALSCTISVIKADRAQDRPATSHVCRETGVSMATNGAFWQIDLSLFCLSVRFEKMTLSRLKSSILAGFCKLNLCCIPF